MIVLSLEEFTSKRKKQQTDLEDDLRPFVRRALDSQQDTHGWIELLQEVRTAWKRTYQSETGLRSPQMPTRFRDQIEDVLKQTDRTSIDEHTLDRITVWLATAILGSVTVTAADDDPADLLVEWVTMEDANVRDAHRQAAGQRQKPGDKFKVGPVEMLAPGDPTVPIEFWVNDRCSLRVVLADASMQSRIDASVELRDVSTKERKKDAAEGRALPDGSFPIDNCSDLKNAIQAIGRAKDPGKAKAHIRKRKSSLGCPEVTLPDTWALTAAAPPDDPTHAGMVVKAHDTGRVLMIQRKNDPEDAPEVQATWEFPGGAIEDGIDDGPEQAAWREFCEETGLSQPEGEMVGGWRSDNGVYQGFVFLVPFESGAFEHINPNLDAADTENPDNPERRHPDVAAWFTVEQAQGLGASLRPECAEMDWGPMADPEENMEFPDPEEESMSTTTTEPVEAPPEVPIEDAATELEWHAVWTVEGMKTGDGRRFGVNAFRSRPLPLPLTWQKVADEGHKGNVTVGRTDRLARAPISEGRNEIRASGKWLGNVEANELIGMVAEFGKFGISIDADDTTLELNDEEEVVDFSDARACSACVVAIPAFSEAWIALGPAPEGFMEGEGIEDLTVEGPNDHVDALVAADVAPGLTEDGPGWLTNYVPTDRLRDWWASAESGVNWGVPGDFRRCELAAAKYVKPQYLAGFCANRHYDALGFWPGQEGTVGASLTDTDPAPSINLVASGGGWCAPFEAFLDPQFAVDDGRTVKQSSGKYGCPLRIIDHGEYHEVLGHLALWNVCHSAINEKCMLAPHSHNDYAYFRLGAVLTDKGEVPTGCLTIGGGHASMRLRMRPAMEHYDNSTAAWADVNVGEDEFGIWFHGIVRPGTTDEMLHAARASKLSGDWRKGEMIAALSVNVPGFAVPRVAASMEGDEVRALVAAGAVEDPEPVDATAAQMADMVEQVAAIIETRRANREAMAVLAQRFTVANREQMLELAARVNGGE